MNAQSGMDRRSFLGRTAGLTGAALALGAWKSEDVAPARTARAGGAAVALELGATDAGAIRGASGGAIVGDVANLPIGSFAWPSKTLRNIEYDEFQLDADVAMPVDLATWINETWRGTLARRSGAITVSDLSPSARREFVNGVITSVELPACDATVARPGVVAVKFKPEQVRWKASTDSKKDPLPKSWTSDHFTFALTGLAATRVSAIDPFVVTQSLRVDLTGQQREVGIAPTRLDFGDLRITLPQSAAGPWAAWAQDFLVRGNGTERTGLLGLFAADMKTYLAHVVFFGVGLREYDDLRADDEPSRHAVATLYVAHAEFHLGAPSGGGGICPSNPCIAQPGA